MFRVPVSGVVIRVPDLVFRFSGCRAGAHRKWRASHCTANPNDLPTCPRGYVLAIRVWGCLGVRVWSSGLGGSGSGSKNWKIVFNSPPRRACGLWIRSSPPSSFLLSIQVLKALAFRRRVHL